MCFKQRWQPGLPSLAREKKVAYVESGAPKLSKLPQITSGILGLHYCAKEQPQCPSLSNHKTEHQPILSKAVRAN
jgi:hypothetical protein